MKKHLLSIIASIVICAVLLIGCGGGGGGGGSSTPSEQSEFIYSTEANTKGTFRLTSSKSGAVIESSEEGTLAKGSSIVLTERLAKSNESKLYGGNSTNIYTLQAKNDNKTVSKLEKPIIITIPNNFGKEYNKFFLGSKSETASDWQYTQILDDNETNPTIVKNARFALKDLNSFKVKTYRLSYSFAIFASKDSGEDKITNSDSVKLMTFSASPTKVYYDKNSKYITDIKVSTCITSNKSSSLFDGSEVTSQVVFFNGSSVDLSGIKIDGVNAVQSSSTTKDSSNNQYSHTLNIKSYKKNNITISGNNATYTFELKLTGVSTKDFPDSFRVKTILKDANGTEFASEGSIDLIKEKEPEKIETNTETDTSTDTITNTEISVSIIPENNINKKVEISTPIKITFNQKMDKTQNLLRLVSLIGNSTNLITSSNQLEWSIENNKDVLTVKNIKLVPEQSYTIKLNSGLKTQSGLISTNQIISSFVTRDAITITSNSLSGQSDRISRNSNIIFTSSNSEAICDVSNARITMNSSNISGTFSIQSDGKIKFVPSSFFPTNTKVTAKIIGIKDYEGATLPDYEFTFETGYFAGEGTEETPYLISTAEELNNLRNVNEKHNYRYFKQTQNIDLSKYGKNYDDGKGWLPIPTDSNTDTYTTDDTWFGFYNGDNHKITNIYMKRNAVGIFNNISGNIKNVGLEISTDGINGNTGAGLANKVTCFGQSIISNCWIGGIGKITCSLDCAGLFNKIEGNIENCHSNISIEGEQYVAGLVSLLTGKMGNCYSSGTIQNLKIGDGSYCGGLVAKAQDSYITNSYSDATINGTEYIGDLVAFANNTNIVNCYTYGVAKYHIVDINVNQQDFVSHIGGLVGYLTNNSIVKNCYSSCEIIGEYGANNCGGLIGYLENSSSISNSYALGNVFVGEFGGGLVGYALNSGNIVNCFAKGQVYGSGLKSGLIGKIKDSGFVKNCYVVGSINIAIIDDLYIGGDYWAGLIGWAENTGGIVNCYIVGDFHSIGKGGIVGALFNSNIRNCYSGISAIGTNIASPRTHRICEADYTTPITSPISNCYAKKDMYITYNTTGLNDLEATQTIQPGLEDPLPETVALDGVDGANLPDNPDWKNDIFKDGYENGTSFDDIWEIGSSGLPILKNMPGNPVQ